MADPTIEDFRRAWPCMTGIQRWTLSWLANYADLLPPYAWVAPIEEAWVLAYAGSSTGIEHWEHFKRAYGLVQEEIEIDGFLLQAIRCVGSPAQVVHDLLESGDLPSEDPCDCEVAFWRNKPVSPSWC